MGTLMLHGMRNAGDEIMDACLRRQHEPLHIRGDLMQSEIAGRQAPAIRYQMTAAGLPLAKDTEADDFTGTPISEGLVKAPATGSFPTGQRNVVLTGGTAAGKTHLAVAIVRALIRKGTRGRVFNIVNLVNRPESQRLLALWGYARRLTGHPSLGLASATRCKSPIHDQAARDCG